MLTWHHVVAALEREPSGMSRGVAEWTKTFLDSPSRRRMTCLGRYSVPYSSYLEPYQVWWAATKRSSSYRGCPGPRRDGSAQACGGLTI